MSKEKRTFTLAEVLIVIGVIGVVAALTIPTLINIISSKAQKAQTDVIEARLLDGINRYSAMEDGLSQKYETTYDFLVGLSKYYKMDQKCNITELSNCFPYSRIVDEDSSIDLGNVTQPKDFGLDNEKYLTPAGFISAQGTPFVISIKKGCIWDNGRAMINLQDSGCIALLYDKNGANYPNKVAEDITEIGGMNVKGYLVKINGIKVMQPAFFSSPGLSISECRNEITAEKQAEYSALIKDDNTVITGCPYNGDHWAAAMKFCKENGWHLPSEAELLTLVQGLYKNTAGEHPTADSVNGYSLDIDLANLINIKNGNGGNLTASDFDVVLWSGKQYGCCGAYIRRFRRYHGTSVYGSTRTENYQTVCIGN